MKNGDLVLVRLDSDPADRWRGPYPVEQFERSGGFWVSFEHTLGPGSYFLPSDQGQMWKLADGATVVNCQHPKVAREPALHTGTQPLEFQWAVEGADCPDCGAGWGQLRADATMEAVRDRERQESSPDRPARYKSVRVVVQYEYLDGMKVTERYQLDPRYSEQLFSDDSASGWPSIAVVNKVPLSAALHARGWLWIAGLVTVPPGSASGAEPEDGCE